jgi:DNA-binding winged helix-turn-helix (wHTH) protein
MRLRFGAFVLDSGTREILRDGRHIALSPKAFLFLEILLRNRPNVVSKEELHKGLWPDTFVVDGNLSNLVSELRSALDDDPQHSRIIRTVPRFGYAFSAPAAPDHGPSEPGAAGASLSYRLVWGRREIALDPGDNLIGREREAVVWIDNESVSRRHARISIGEEGASIEDLGSKNGTYVGGKKIRSPASLTDRAVVRIGPATMVLRVLKRTGSTRSTMSRNSSK